MWIKSSLIVGLALTFLVGCDDDDKSESSLQAVHASVDTPKANLKVNGESKLTGVDYGVGSGFFSVPADTNSLIVDVQLPGGATTTVIPSTDVYMDKNNRYTVFVVGQAASGSSFPVEAIVVTRPLTGQASSSTLDVQVVHASAGVPDVDLYVTAPGADINSASALDTLAFKDDTGVLNIASGSYQIRLTLAGTKTVAFDSGTVALSANSELTIAAIPNQDSGATSPVKLVVLDGSNSSQIINASEQAELEVGHLVSDFGIVDISIDGTEAISNVSFKGLTGYTASTSLAQGEYDIVVYQDDTPATLVLTLNNTSVVRGGDYGVFAVGKAATTVEGLLIETDRRPVATSAKLNVIHAAPDASTVDVYLTASTDISSASPAISSFDFKESEQGIYVAAGSYFVTVTPTGTKTAAIGPVAVTVADDKVYQAIAANDLSIILSEIED